MKYPLNWFIATIAAILLPISFWAFFRSRDWNIHGFSEAMPTRSFEWKSKASFSFSIFVWNKKNESAFACSTPNEISTKSLALNIILISYVDWRERTICEDFCYSVFQTRDAFEFHSVFAVVLFLFFEKAKNVARNVNLYLYLVKLGTPITVSIDYYAYKLILHTIELTYTSFFPLSHMKLKYVYRKNPKCQKDSFLLSFDKKRQYITFLSM